MFLLAAVMILCGYQLDDSIRLAVNVGFWFYMVVWPPMLLLGIMARYRPLIFQSISALIFAPFYIPILMTVHDTPTDVKSVASLVIIGGMISLFLQFPTLFKIR